MWNVRMSRSERATPVGGLRVHGSGGGRKWGSARLALACNLAAPPARRVELGVPRVHLAHHPLGAPHRGCDGSKDGGGCDVPTTRRIWLDSCTIKHKSNIS